MHVTRLNPAQPPLSAVSTRGCCDVPPEVEPLAVAVGLGSRKMVGFGTVVVTGGSEGAGDTGALDTGGSAGSVVIGGSGCCGRWRASED